MKIVRAFALAAIAFSATGLDAQVTTYTYTGSPFTAVMAPYTTSDSITGTFTTSSPIPGGLTFNDNPGGCGNCAGNVAALVTNYSFSDGVNTWDTTNTVTSGLAAAEFFVNTDAQGNIVSWYIVLIGATAPFQFGEGLLSTQNCCGTAADQVQFYPDVRTFSDASGPAGTWAAVSRYTISGQVTQSGTGLSGVTVTLSGSGSGSASTDANGNYSFTGLNPGGSYTVTPSSPVLSFTPPSQTFNSLNSNQTANFTAAPISYTISGQVMVSGSGFGEVTVTLSGSGSGSTATDGNGNYSFTGLSSGGSYTVTPSYPNVAFTPPSQTFNSLGANQTANFTGAGIQYTISGQVTYLGSPLSGVTITLTTGPIQCLQVPCQNSTTTDANGDYSFTRLNPGSNYTVTPSRTGYTFTPPSQSFTSLASNQTANFTATAVIYTISGQITLSGSAFSGVTVALSGGQSASASTDGNGNYSFNGLGAGGNYTVTPSRAGYTFTPPSQTFNSLAANQSANFTAALASAQPTVYTYTGNHFTTAISPYTTSDSLSLKLTFAGALGPNAFPNCSGFVFSSITLSDGINTYNSTNPTGLAGLDVCIGTDSSGNVSVWAVSLTDPSGTHILINSCGYLSGSTSGSNCAPGGNLPYDQAQFMKPDGSYPYATNSGIQGTWTISTVPLTYTISGQATQSAAGLAGVTMTLSGSQTASTTTDANGNYSFTGLAAGGSYTVTPARSGYAFTPPSQAFNSLAANQTANFSAAPVMLTISGQVTLSGSGLTGVTLTLTGAKSASTSTDAGGNYSFTGLAAGGSYTVTPASSGYTFTPPSQAFNAVSSNQSFNFAAIAIAPPVNLPPSPGPPTPPGGTGASHTFVYTFSDPQGWQELDVVNILIDNFLDGRNSCYLAYSRSAGVLYLVNDSGTALLAGLPLNGAGSVSNSQCSVIGVGSSALGKRQHLDLDPGHDLYHGVRRE